MGRLFIIIGITGAVFAGQARAATGGGSSYQHEVNINGGLGSAANFAIATKGGGKAITVNAGYAYSLMPMLQIGLYPSLLFLDVGTGGSTLLNALGGLTLNFDPDHIQDSIFLFGAAGINDITGATKFGLRADIGKRFKIWDHVSYRPTAGIKWQDGGVVVINVELLAASIQF